MVNNSPVMGPSVAASGSAPPVPLGVSLSAVNKLLSALPPESSYPIDKYGHVVIPSGVQAISATAFAGCSFLRSVDLPESLRSIGESAFENCSSLQALELPSSVTNIGRRAFFGCSKLSLASLPASAEAGEDAFTGCSVRLS